MVSRPFVIGRDRLDQRQGFREVYYRRYNALQRYGRIGAPVWMDMPTAASRWRSRGGVCAACPRGRFYHADGNPQSRKVATVLSRRRGHVSVKSQSRGLWKRQRFQGRKTATIWNTENGRNEYVSIVRPVPGGHFCCQILAFKTVPLFNPLGRLLWLMFE